MRYLALLVLVSLLTGCAAAPASVRPADARSLLLADPGVAAWYARHSAPAVLEGMSPRVSRTWRKYRPAVMFDLVKEGYRVTLESEFGPAPRKLEALMDRESGALLSVKVAK